jgi:hypothetical protein
VGKAAKLGYEKKKLGPARNRDGAAGYDSVIDPHSTTVRLKRAAAACDPEVVKQCGR